MKRFSLFLCWLTVSLAALAEGRAKYVFYFIGDGMGVNQVNVTQTYLAALEGRIGIKPLCFTTFPQVALVTTYSATNGVTDSAAGGTALATGHKTRNGALGVEADGQTPVSSLAYMARAAGAAVGIATSVSVDHATPAAFYAHQGQRGSYYTIGQDLIKAGFDFYAGSDFLQPQKKDAADASLYRQTEEAGFTLARGYKDYLKKSKKAERLILLPTEATLKRSANSLPYAIDRLDGDMTLEEITRAAVHFLSKQSKDGFFLMVEGGKIDWACHSNDVATVIHEVIDMDKAIRVAFEFMAQHPDETLIVVTADHETGGIVMGRGPYELHTDLLRYQRLSVEAYAAHLKELHASLGEGLTWDVVKKDLTDHWGLMGPVAVSDRQETRLKQAYEALVKGVSADKKSLYASINGLADEARAILAECALIGWQSGGHSNGYVPAFATGVGASLIHGQMDNVELPLRIAEAAGYRP